MVGKPIEITQKQMEVSDIGALLDAQNSGIERPKSTSVSSGRAGLKPLWRQWDRLSVNYGMLYRRFLETPSNNEISCSEEYA
jgi:hypothetical protein